MSRVKDIWMYLLALVVLLAPVIILGWIGLSLLDGIGLGWLGLIVGVMLGLVIFIYSVNKVAGQDAAEDEVAPVTPEYETSEK